MWHSVKCMAETNSRIAQLTKLQNKAIKDLAKRLGVYAQLEARRAVLLCVRWHTARDPSLSRGRRPKKLWIAYWGGFHRRRCVKRELEQFANAVLDDSNDKTNLIQDQLSRVNLASDTLSPCGRWQLRDVLKQSMRNCKSRETNFSTFGWLHTRRCSLRSSSSQTGLDRKELFLAC